MGEKWTQERVDEMVRLHGMWLRGEPGGEQAYVDNEIFYNLDLSGVNLNRAVLRYVRFTQTNLKGAMLCGADLYNSEFGRARLCSAIIAGSNLMGARFREVYATDAILAGSNLMDAYLFGSEFGRSSFLNADMNGAHLYGNNFKRANLSGAHLPTVLEGENDFSGADFMYSTLAETGVGIWKQAGVSLREVNIERVKSSDMLIGNTMDSMFWSNEAVIDFARSCSEEKLKLATDYLKSLAEYED